MSQRNVYHLLRRHLQKQTQTMGQKVLESYQPKGGMCCSCLKLTHDCSLLVFKDMQLLSKDHYPDENVSIVKCAHFERKIKKINDDIRNRDSSR